MSKIYKYLQHIFALALIISDIYIYIYTFQIFDIKKVGYGHGVEFSELHHSKADAKIYKCLPHIFVLALTVSYIYKFKNKFP